MCDFKNLDDEYHNMCQCKNEYKLRGSILPRYYWQHPGTFKFTQMLSSFSENTKLVPRVGK